MLPLPGATRTAALNRPLSPLNDRQPRLFCRAPVAGPHLTTSVQYIRVPDNAPYSPFLRHSVATGHNSH